MQQQAKQKHPGFCALVVEHAAEQIHRRLELLVIVTEYLFQHGVHRKLGRVEESVFCETRQSRGVAWPSIVILPTETGIPLPSWSHTGRVP